MWVADLMLFSLSLKTNSSVASRKQHSFYVLAVTNRKFFLENFSYGVFFSVYVVSYRRRRRPSRILKIVCLPFS